MIILLSQGGIGNQLFQYSALLYLNLISSRRPYIDPYSFHGKKDKLYGRSFSLSDFTSHLLLSPFKSLLIKIIYKIVVTFFSQHFTKKTFFSKFLSLLVVGDNNFHSCVNLVKSYRIVILHGYFQFPEIPFYLKTNSPNLFKDIFEYRSSVLSQYNIPSHSVAICFRAYEEACFPSHHFVHFGASVSDNLQAFAGVVANTLSFSAHFYTSCFKIFTTSNSSRVYLRNVLKALNHCHLNELEFSSPADFDELIAISGFSFIFLNHSTFYWWASFLSLGSANTSSSNVFIPEEFLPSSSYPSDNYSLLRFQ